MGRFFKNLMRKGSKNTREPTKLDGGEDNMKVFGKKLLYEIPPDKPHPCYVAGLPVVVYKCIGYLYHKGMTVEGLFRVSASKEQVEKLIDLIDSGVDVDLNDPNYCGDPHIAASLLKKYFRMLPEPLFIYDTYEFLITVSKNKALSHQEKLDQIKRITNTLPTVHFDTLGVLMLFLHDISLNYKTNKMDSMNLAICFAPNLLRLDDDSNKDVLDMGDATSVIRMLIDESKDAFEDISSKAHILQKRMSTTDAANSNYMGLCDDVEFDDIDI